MWIRVGGWRWRGLGAIWMWWFGGGVVLAGVEGRSWEARVVRRLRAVEDMVVVEMALHECWSRKWLFGW